MTDERPLDEQLTAREDGGVLWLTLNRPEAANAVTPDQRDRLIELLDDASGRLEVRAVVITATGKHFCTGADLRHSRPGPVRPEGVPELVIGDVARMIHGGAQRLITAVVDCEKPVIGAINGTAAGIGAHLALACDLVVAVEEARFIEVFVRRGLVPDGAGAWLLPRLIGLQKAKEMMFFGDAVPAAEAERLGLVNRVVPADELEKVAGEWAARLATGPTRSIGLTKAPAQPVARQRPGHGLPRRGPGAGAEHADPRRQRGRRRLQGAPRPRLPGLVAGLERRWEPVRLHHRPPSLVAAQHQEPRTRRCRQPVGRVVGAFVPDEHRQPAVAVASQPGRAVADAPAVELVGGEEQVGAVAWSATRTRRPAARCRGRSAAGRAACRPPDGRSCGSRPGGGRPG